MNKLQGIRQAAEVIAVDGNWQVKVGKTVKAFGLTEERAKEWARWWKGGRAVKA